MESLNNLDNVPILLEDLGFFLVQGLYCLFGENQKDSDSLPPYEVLDKILYHLVEKEKSIKEITHMGFDFDLVKKVEHLLYSSEYKRRQAAPGVKISERNFGYDRRYPITNSFRDMDN